MKAYILDISTNELSTGFKEKELNRLLHEEKHLRSEQKEILHWLKRSKP